MPFWKNCLSIFAVLSFAVKVNSTMNVSCYRSDDPGAQNATQLINITETEGHLWTRKNLTTLPLCSSSFSSASKYDVCSTKKSVYVAGPDLTEEADLRLEGDGVSFELKKSNCPALPTIPPTPTPGDDQSGPSGAPVTIIFILIGPAVIGIFIGLIIKCQRAQPNEDNGVV